MYDYISVFAPDETDFSHNGLRILCPVSCEITEVLNGEYSLTLNPPRDEWVLRKVTIDNAAEADRVFSMLMGDEVPPRREFIEKHAHYANIDA